MIKYIIQFKLLFLGLFVWSLSVIMSFGYLEDGYLIQEKSPAYLLSNLALFVAQLLLLWVLLGYPGLRKPLSDIFSFIWAPLFLLLVVSDYIAFMEAGLIDELARNVGIISFTVLMALSTAFNLKLISINAKK